MVTLGVSTRLLWEAEKNIILGLDFISKSANAAELWLMPPFFPSWRMPGMKGDLDKIKDALSVYELKTTIHAPHHDLNMSSLNPAVSSVAVREIEKCLEIADHLGSIAVTFHPGSFKYWRESGLVALNASLARLDRSAREYNAILCLENMFGENKFCLGSAEIDSLLRPVEHIYVTLDLAHVLAQDEGISEFTGRLGGKIRSVHISNLKDKHHKHMPLMAGDLDFKEALSALHKAGYGGPFILEGVSKNPYETIPKDIHELRRMLAEAGFT
jgi:sugar phosphate isomerase/epimerase